MRGDLEILYAYFMPSNTSSVNTNFSNATLFEYKLLDDSL